MIKTILLLALGCVLALTACAPTTTTPKAFNGNQRPNVDGLPVSVDNFDHNTVPNAKPKVEPVSKSGNPRSYKALGNTYYVSHTSKDYKQKGFASWYGNKFHGKSTSSGEPYDMFAMTAASRTLPIPTYVRVKNLENGKEIVVKVNDRGPFHDDRIIDLSYTAAAKLGLLSKGTALVEVVALAPYQQLPVKKSRNSQKKPTVTASKKSSEQLYVQAGAFSHIDNAKKLSKKLGTITQSPIIIKSNAEKTIYRVQVGPLATAAARDEIMSALNDAGIKNSSFTAS